VSLKIIIFDETNKKVMSDLFYMIGVIYFFYEIVTANDARPHLERIRFSEKIKGLENKKSKREFLENMPIDDKKSFIRKSAFGLSYLIWLVLGILFSGQWMLFTFILGFGILTGFYRRRFYKDNTRRSLKVIKIDAFVSCIVIAFLIINHFHQIL